MSIEGKKIDEVRLDWQTSLVIRYHSEGHDFTVEAGDQSFKGEDLKSLLEKGRVHMAGWSKLTWEPVIVIDTEVYTGFSFSYRRCFRSKHKGQPVFQAWKVGKENEGEFDRYDKQKTGEIIEGEPGSVMSRVKGRVVPFTPARWMQVRNLSKSLHAALETAELKLSQMLKQDDIDQLLGQVGGAVAPRITFVR